MNAPRVLVVEDNPADLNFVVAALSDANYALVAESNPRKAFERFEGQGPWHLVISDLRMRDIDGLALLKRIKGHDPSTETIIVTGRADIGSAIEALNLGASSYLAKPFHRQQLRHCVAQALERQRLAAEQQRLIRELEERDARRRREIATIASMGDMLSRMRSPMEISDDLLRKIAAALGTECVAFFLLDEARNELVLTAQHGLPQAIVNKMTQTRLPAAEWSKGCPLSCIERILIEIEKDASLDPRACTPAFRAQDVNSFLSVLLRPQRELIGCLVALTLCRGVRAFTSEDREFLEAIAHLIGNAIQATRREQQARDAEKLVAVGELAAGVAHELGNALAVVSGAAQFLLAKADVPSPVRRHVEVIYRSVAAGEKIIKDLLSFARPSPPCRVPTEIEPILEQALLFLKREMANARIKVSRHYWPGPLQILADAQQVQQVFLNILLNAIQAMPRGGTLTLRTIPEPPGPPWTGVQVEIADTGDGISAEHRHRIFDPFFTMKEGGTGLGLSVSRRIVTAHGGKLSVQSQEGHGAQFAIHLPVSPPAGSPSADASG